MDSKIGCLVHFVGFCVNTIGFVYGTFVAYDYDGVSSVLQYRGWPGKLKYLTYWCEVSFRFCWTTSYVGVVPSLSVNFLVWYFEYIVMQFYWFPLIIVLMLLQVIQFLYFTIAVLNDVMELNPHRKRSRLHRFRDFFHATMATPIAMVCWYYALARVLVLVMINVDWRMLTYLSQYVRILLNNLYFEAWKWHTVRSANKCESLTYVHSNDLTWMYSYFRLF